jgi:hypothetical protein
VDRPRAADDFATIRARLDELRREREQMDVEEVDLQPKPPARRGDRIDGVMIPVRRLRSAAA